jgi:hypothetical protein
MRTLGIACNTELRIAMTGSRAAALWLAALAVATTPCRSQTWQGNAMCWSGEFTFEACCDLHPVSQLARAPGRADCWSGIWTFHSCFCLEPQDCQGTWSQCSTECTKQFSVSAAAENGGVACAATDGELAACLVGEGACPASGRSCNATSVRGLQHGSGGNCNGRDAMPHGEQCEVTCDDGYAFSGIQPRCFDGALLHTGGCRWEGRADCWNSTHTFDRCCLQENGTVAIAPGDSSCWSADGTRSFESCRCMEPPSDALAAAPPDGSQLGLLTLLAAILAAIIAGVVAVVCKKRRSQIVVVNEKGELVGELEAKVSSLEKQMLEQMVASCLDKAEASMAEHQQAELEALQR